MKSDRARRSGDLYKVLPWVFGFPRGKPGPRRLLDPYGGPPLIPKFAHRFWRLLEEGQDPVRARRNAYNDVFDEKIDNDVEDEMLRNWLLKDFGLKKWPRTAKEWKTDWPLTLLHAGGS
jgi:hypothetical protein